MISKVKERERIRRNAQATLLELTAQNTEIYVIQRHVSASGMQRRRH